MDFKRRDWMMNTQLNQAKYSSTIKIYSSDTDGPDDGWTLVYEGPLHHRMKVIAPVQNGKCPYHQEYRNIDLYLEIIDGDVNCPCSLYFCNV